MLRDARKATIDDTADRNTIYPETLYDRKLSAVESYIKPWLHFMGDSPGELSEEFVT